MKALPRAILASVVAGLSASAALAQAPAIHDPDWAPTGGVNLSQYFPDRALRLEVSGWARLRCQVGDELRAKDCVVLGEAPGGFGFGKAGLNITALRTLKPETHGVPVAGRTIITEVKFAIDGEPFIVRDRETWAARPTGEQVAAARPSQSPDAYGEADVGCLGIDPDGALSDCTVRAESPMGEGYGQAALSLSPLYRAPRSMERSHHVRFEIRWQAPADLAPNIWSDHPWSAAPAVAQIEAVRPAGLTGQPVANLKCEVDAGGGLTACEVNGVLWTRDNGRIQATPSPEVAVAARSLLPLYRFDPEALARLQATPLAVFHINFEP